MSDNEQSGTSQSALPTTDLRQVVQETVANTVAQLSNSLASSIDQRLEELKRSFVPAQPAACASKKLKLEAQTIKKPGNAHQYGHEVKVLEKFEEAIDELDRNKIEKARSTLQEGKSIVLQRIKLIRIADKSSYGWDTVNQYEAEELASDSEYDKKIYRSQRRAEKARKEKRQRKKAATSTSTTPQPIPTVSSNRPTLAARTALGPCYTCGLFGHLQAKCPQ